MTTVDVHVEGELAVPRPQKPRRRLDVQPGTIVRAVLFGALAIAALVYVGPSEIGEMLLKVLVGVGLSTVLFVGANKLFDLVYDQWTVFCSVSGFAVGAVTLLILDGNRLLRDIGPRPWIWALVGGVTAGAVLFALSAPREQVAKLPLAVAGFGGLGVLLALAIDDAWHPALGWGKLLICAAVGTAIGAGWRLRAASGTPERVANGALVGGALGWLVGAWGGADFAVRSAETEALSGGGNLAEALVATVIPLAAIGVRIGLAAEPTTTERRNIEQRSRSWIFTTPALAFIAGGLLIPLVRTIYISLRNQTSAEYVGLANFRTIFNDRNFFDVSDWNDLFTSRLFWVGAGVVVIGVAIGVVNGRKTRQAFESAPSSLLPTFAGLFLAACAVFATLRGTLFNNLWWVLVVTTLAASIGLAAAVLADRSKGENIAKSLIFLPMAISFVGAGVIWRFVYQPRNIRDPQTGLLNAIWVGLGELSNSSWAKWLVAAVIAAVIVGLALLAWTGTSSGNYTRTGLSLGVGLVLAFLLYRLLGPGLGGFEVRADGEVRAQTIEFVTETPFNNMWLMVILIWIQTGFAMVIFSSAIKAVPTDLTEAARIDGATESQVFWRVTLPQIAPTIGVVVTTLIVIVIKLFDIVKVTTNGQFGTQVIANQMFRDGIERGNAGLGGALATALFLAVLPVMFYNIRRMQKAKA